jgi:acyl dehydratase
MQSIDLVEPPDLYFEDFVMGQEFPVVTKGPIMVGHQVRWAGATDNYDSEFHHDEYVAKELGLPGIILSGPFIAAYLRATVENWVGRNARLTRFGDRNTGSTMPRDMLYLRGSVSKLYRDGDRCLIDIDCRVENQRGENTTPSTATAEIASRGSADQGSMA